MFSSIHHSVLPMAELLYSRRMIHSLVYWVRFACGFWFRRPSSWKPVQRLSHSSRLSPETVCLSGRQAPWPSYSRLLFLLSNRIYCQPTACWHFHWHSVRFLATNCVRFRTILDLWHHTRLLYRGRHGNSSMLSYESVLVLLYPTWKEKNIYYRQLFFQ